MFIIELKDPVVHIISSKLICINLSNLIKQNKHSTSQIQWTYEWMNEYVFIKSSQMQSISRKEILNNVMSKWMNMSVCVLCIAMWSWQNKRMNSGKYKYVCLYRCVCMFIKKQNLCINILSNQYKVHCISVRTSTLHWLKRWREIESMNMKTVFNVNVRITKK